MSQRTLPNFICIGIQKAGTSWLYSMLKQHPEVLVSEPKELHYFNRDVNYRKGWDWYLSHFQGHGTEKAVGEMTPDYLWIREEHREVPGFVATPNVPKRMAEVLPDIRLIAILRNPVTRAVSSYFHHIGAARLSPNRRITEVGDEWGILSMGYYADHLEHWYQYYPPERFQILIYEEDLLENTRPSTLRQVFEHIGVDPGFEVTNPEARYNKRRSPFDYRLSRLPGRLQGPARQYVPEFVKNSRFWDIPVSRKELDTLEEHFRSHNDRLAALLGRPLPWG